MRMNTAQVRAHDYPVRVPDVPMHAIREYIRVLCQMHTVKSIVAPGHPWFDHHMRRLQNSAEDLKKLCAHRAAARAHVQHFAKVEVERWLDDCHADMTVRLSVLESLKQGLPQVYDDRPV